MKMYLYVGKYPFDLLGMPTSERLPPNDVVDVYNWRLLG